MKPLIKIIYEFVKHNFELFFWIIGLTYLIFIDPYETGHFSFCGFKLLGFDSCPGCGLGRSISLIYHGDIINSVKMHPLGILALAMISFRIITIIKLNFKKYIGVYNG